MKKHILNLLRVLILVTAILVVAALPLIAQADEPKNAAGYDAIKDAIIASNAEWLANNPPSTPAGSLWDTAGTNLTAAESLALYGF